MSWDIYGNPLKAGHCEAHPYVAEPFPCSICRQAQEQEKLERIHDARAQEFHAKKKEEREKLRDQFAMAALPECASEHRYKNDNGETVAKEAYMFADAMLKEREK